MPRAIDGWKVCSSCEERKPVSEFNRDIFRIDGLEYWCRACKKRCRQRYNRSEEGQVASRYYRRSNEGKAVSQHYRQSAQGKAAQRRHYARKAGCVGSHTYEEFLDLCELYDFRCLRCGEQFDFDEDLTEDHVIPIGPGVSNRIDNIQPLCKPCNSWKGRQTIDYRGRRERMSRS